MNNLASFTLFMLMAHTVNAQLPVNWPNYTPFLSSPDHHYNHRVLPTKQNAPILQQNSDQHILHREAMMSVVLRELKETSKRLAETNIVVENVKNELAQLKKSVEEKDKAESLNNESNESKTQTEMPTTEFDALVYDNGGNREIPTFRFCNCLGLQQMINILNNNLVATNIKFDGITDKIIEDLISTDVKFEETTNRIATDLTDATTTIKKTTDDITNTLIATNGDLQDLTADFEESISTTTIDKEPSSCTDLKELGYKKSGIFPVIRGNQMESVYCDFTKFDSPADFEKKIGIIDIKTIRVSFHAQITEPYSTISSTVPFDQLLTNEGSAMSETTGIFTAPTAGTYFFAYSGISSPTTKARVQLQKKTPTEQTWSPIGTAYSTDGDFQTFALDATLLLDTGDQISIFLMEGAIYEYPSLGEQHTNFVGILLEEKSV